MERPANASNEASDRGYAVIQRLLILGGLGFFGSFSGWIVWNIVRGDPYAAVLGPVVVGLLLSIATVCLARCLWVVVNEGRRKAGPVRPASVAAARYEIGTAKYLLRNPAALRAGGGIRARALESRS